MGSVGEEAGGGNIARKRVPRVSGIDAEVSATVGYRFDPDGGLTRPASIEVRDGAGRLLRKRQGTYNGTGDLERLEQTLVSGRDPETGFTYSGSKNAVWTLTHDELGNIASSADPTGYTSTFTYDA